MNEAETKEWKLYFSFLREVAIDSPRSGNDETMEWHLKMIEKLEKLVFEGQS